MTQPLTEEQISELKHVLKRCSPETIEATINFRSKGDIQNIPAIVYGIIERYSQSETITDISKAADETILSQDLGIDSLTMLEIVLSIEEALGIRIENEELKQIQTLGQVKEFLKRKVTEKPGEVKKKSSSSLFVSKEDVLMTLPQQFPFLFVDEAEINGETIIGKFKVKGDEFFFDGHFKDNPVLPASIVFEAMGQVASVWVLKKGCEHLGRELATNEVLFGSMDGAHFYKKGKPGDLVEMELKLLKVRDPIAIFEGTATVNGEKLAAIQQLVLFFGDIETAKKVQEQATQPATV